MNTGELGLGSTSTIETSKVWHPQFSGCNKVFIIFYIDLCSKAQDLVYI